MTSQQWVGLAVRLNAIWLLVYGLEYLAAIPPALDSAAVEGKGLAYAVGALHLAAAIALWFFPMTVAHTLVPRTHDTRTLEPSAFEAARVAVAIPGLYLLIRSGSVVVLILFNTYLFAGTGSILGAMTPEAKIETAAQAVIVGVSPWLLLRSAPVARIILRSRRAPESPDVAQPRPELE